MRVFIISDPHFGHRNIAIKRGFNSVEEHDEHIVEKWNSVITKNDTVWVLGDITMEKANYAILDRLKGYKKVILGNHDRPQHIPEMLKHVNSVCGARQLKGFMLTHIPIHVTEIGRFRANIHGHVHSKSIDDPRYINVCCEVVDYTPVLIDSLWTE